MIRFIEISRFISSFNLKMDLKRLSSISKLSQRCFFYSAMCRSAISSLTKESPSGTYLRTIRPIAPPLCVGMLPLVLWVSTPEDAEASATAVSTQSVFTSEASPPALSTSGFRVDNKINHHTATCYGSNHPSPLR